MASARLVSLLALTLTASCASAQRFGLGRPGLGPGGVAPGGQLYPQPPQPPAWPPGPGMPGMPGMLPVPGGGGPGLGPGLGPGHHGPAGPGYPAYGDSDGLGSPCHYDEDCDWMEHTYCRGQQACQCKRGFAASPAGDRCLATVGAPCSTKYDCAGLGAAGECHQGVCDCGAGDVPAPDGTCLKAALQVNDRCVEDLQCEALGLDGPGGPAAAGRAGLPGHGPRFGPGNSWAGALCVDNKCQCAVGKHASRERDRCIDNRALHEPCSDTAECYIGEGYQSVIHCHMGTCRCRERYVDLGDGKCTAGAEKMKIVSISVIILGFLTQLLL